MIRPVSHEAKTRARLELLGPFGVCAPATIGSAMRLFASCLLFALASTSSAQDAPPPKPATDAPPRAPATDAPPRAPAEPAPKPEEDPRRVAHLRALDGTVVHFDFRRAPLEDITAALQVATKVPVRIGDAARKVLARRKLKLRYTADRTGRQVLEDLAKAAALDVEVTPDGAVIDTARELKKLRKQLGLATKQVELTGDDVERLLDSKRLSLVCRERTLGLVLTFLRDETGIRIVRLDGEQPDGGPERPEPKLTHTITDEPLRSILDQLLKPLGWAWARQGTVLVVGPAEVVAAHVEPEEDDGAGAPR